MCTGWPRSKCHGSGTKMVIVTVVRITTVEAADESRPTRHQSPGHCMLLYAACACRVVRSLPGDALSREGILCNGEII